MSLGHCSRRYEIRIMKLRNNPLSDSEMNYNVILENMHSEIENRENIIQIVILPYWMNSIVKKVCNNEYFIKWEKVILKCIVEWYTKIGRSYAQEQDKQGAIDMMIKIISECEIKYELERNNARILRKHIRLAEKIKTDYETHKNN